MPSVISVIRCQLDRYSWWSRVRLVLRTECVSTVLRGVVSRDVMSLRHWTSEGIAYLSACNLWFVTMEIWLGIYSPVASSANCVVPSISGGVWNWSVVSKQVDALNIIPFSCSALVVVVDVLLAWQHRVVS